MAPSFKPNQAAAPVQLAKAAIETAAQTVLDAAVDAAYALNGGKKSWKTDAERVAFLFTRYEALTNLSAST